MSIFTVITLSFSMSLVQGMRHGQETFQAYRGLSSLRDLLAEIQETANKPQDLANGAGIGAIYAAYHGKVFPAPDLPSGQIAVTCYANEAAVPAVLEGPQDLNMDGDAQDNLAGLSNGTDLKLVPLELTLSFVEGGKTWTIATHRLVTRTSN
jgi:hypothetical protein